MEKYIQRAKDWLEEVLKLMGVPATVEVQEKYESPIMTGVWLVIDEANLTPEQVQLIVGYKGQGLDALQYLLNTQMNIGVAEDDHHTFMVELEGYRRRRQTELLTWSKEVADRVRLTSKPVEMTELSGAERRQVHTFFQGEVDLETESQGQEPDRRLVVRLKA
ncbi:MAG: protein jag [Microcystaceae cyanobacterium]